MLKQIEWQRTDSIWHNHDEIVAVWAFGSAQNGTVHKEGDVDVGVLAKRPFTLNEQLALLGEIQSALQVEEIDLVFLNDANSIVRFEAVSGRRLFCRDASQMATFVSLTAREYEDEMGQWQKSLHALEIIK